MKSNNYFENMFDNLFNHCWVATGSKQYSNASVGKLVDKIEFKHSPRGKCYKRMYNMYWARQS